MPASSIRLSPDFSHCQWLSFPGASHRQPVPENHSNPRQTQHPRPPAEFLYDKADVLMTFRLKSIAADGIELVLSEISDHLQSDESTWWLPSSADGFRTKERNRCAAAHPNAAAGHRLYGFTASTLSPHSIRCTAAAHLIPFPGDCLSIAVRREAIDTAQGCDGRHDSELPASHTSCRLLALFGQSA